MDEKVILIPDEYIYDFKKSKEENDKEFEERWKESEKAFKELFGDD